MGNDSSTHHCLEKEEITDILDDKRSALTQSEVECLYAQFNNVTKLFEQHSHSDCLKCPNIAYLPTWMPITCYTLIAIFHGPVMAFRIKDDPIPYILFHYENVSFTATSQVIKEAYNRWKRSQQEDAELLDLLHEEERILLITTAIDKESKSYGRFHWVLSIEYKGMVF